MLRMFSVIVLMALTAVNGLSQTIIRVPQDHATIQAAINAAASGDTVVIDEGRYMVNLKLTKKIVLGSLYVLDGDTSHISRTILDGSTPSVADSGSVIFVAGTADSTTVIEGLTITGGRGTYVVDPGDGSKWYGGGGIMVWGNGARIRKNHIIFNRITSTNAVPNVWGGGIASSLATDQFPLLIVEHNQISRNTITSSVAAEAAGLSVAMRARIVHNVIDSNTATGGSGQFVIGGISVYAHWMNTVEFTGNIIRGNVSSNYSGGIRIYRPATSGGCSVIMTNNLIVGNRAVRGGGGIDLNISCSLTLINNTIAHNTASWCGGMLVRGTAVTASKVIGINNIFWNNTAVGGDITQPAYESLHNNLIKGESIVGENNFSADPKFASDGSYALTAESPCIAAGTITRTVLGTALMAPPDDINGSPRPWVMPDLGAIESELSFTTAARPNRAEVRKFTTGTYVGRHYTVFRPKGMESATDRPVILYLHGYDGTLDWDMNDYRIHLYGDTIGAVTVYPEAVSRRWNSGLSEVLGWSTPSVDDVGFISMLIDTLHALYQIDTTRVHVVGYSNGGWMLHKLAKMLSRRITSGVIVSGAMAPSVYNAPAPSRIVPLMIIHGTSDPIVLYTAATGRYGTEAEVASWRSWNRAFGRSITDTINANSGDQSWVVRQQFYGGSDSMQQDSLRLVYYRIQMGTHEWPNGGAWYGAPAINRDFNVMSDAIRFFTNPLVRVTEEDPDPVPASFALYQNYPNPFNPTTQISFQLPLASHISLRVFDLLGREVAVLVNEEKPAGSYTAQWDAAGFASGIYLVRMQAGSFVDTKKIVLMK